MRDWIKENKTVLTIAISAVAAIAAVLTVILTSAYSIHHRLDDMNHRLNDIRAEMNQRFDVQDKSINQRFDAQDESIDQRFDATSERIDRLTVEVHELRGLIVGISERVSHNEGQIDVLIQQLKTADAPAP